MLTHFPFLVLRVQNVPAMIAFYRDALGLHDLSDPTKAIGGVRLPNGTVLEIAPGGSILPAVEDRKQSPLTPVFAVAAVEPVVEAVVAHGGRIVNPPMPTPEGQTIAYAADPEGHVFGVVTLPEGWRA